MNKVTIQITIEVEYEQVHPDSDRLLKQMLSKLEGQVHASIGMGMLSPPINDEYDINSWEIRVQTKDHEKEKQQFQSERNSPFASITAYFSSDGPAVAVNIHGLPLGAASDGMSLIISDINGALREAHHKYLAHLREP